ncbi:MAG: LacI family DNA-binding transcriptional regulator [Microbacterium sp.]|uniref:LacI family DNA-binding transcriptional regulator n=1 Tax=Microbacterium sp. TaxID=51671 RepID=UPI003F810D60
MIGLYLPVDVGIFEYYMRFVFGATARARDEGFALTILLAGRDAVSQQENLDGVLIVDPLAGDDGVAALLSHGAPVVSSEHPPDLDGGSAIVVEPDHRAIMFALLDHLADRGARRPAFIGAGDTSTWGRRIAAEYLTWCGLRRVEPVLHQTSFTASAETIGGIADDLLRRTEPPDAILTAPDGAALGVLDAARSHGLEVGRNLLVAAAVDSTAFKFVEPGITAVDLHPSALGARCAQLLLDWVDTGVRPNDAEPVPFELIVRGSTRGAE